MVAIRGGLAGPDLAQPDGFYRNEIQTDRSALFDALGGRQGIIRGLNLVSVPGQLALDLGPGSALALERDGSNVEQARGYYLWTPTIVRVPFAAPSVGVRRDALVACFIDAEAAGLTGTFGLPVGPHLVALPGTSGVSTSMSYSQICTLLGRGGHTRIADVLISPGDTQVLPAAFGDRNNRLGKRKVLSLTAETGFSIQSQTYLWTGLFSVEVIIKGTRTGSTLTASGSGNLDPNVKFASSLLAEIRPDATAYGTWNNDGAKTGGWSIDTDGNCSLTDMTSTGAMAAGATFTARMHYAVPQA